MSLNDADDVNCINELANLNKSGQFEPLHTSIESLQDLKLHIPAAEGDSRIKIKYPANQALNSVTNKASNCNAIEILSDDLSSRGRDYGYSNQRLGGGSDSHEKVKQSNSKTEMGQIASKTR